MDMLSGGDLRYHICKHRRFTEEQTSKLDYHYFKNTALQSKEAQTLTNFMHRIFHSVFGLRPGICPQQEHLAQGYKAGKPSAGWRWLSSYNWLRHRKRVEGGKLAGHVRYPRLYGPWSHVQAKPRRSCWLFCRRSHGLWVHVWKGRKPTMINTTLETLCRQVEIGDQRPHSRKADTDQAQWDP